MANKLLYAGFWLPFVVCTYLAFAPSPPEAVFRVSDVVLHAGAFLYLTFALSLCYFPGRFWVTASWMLAYGIAIEAGQSLEPERSAELKDLAVDVVGIGFAGLLIRYLTSPVQMVVERVARWF